MSVAPKIAVTTDSVLVEQEPSRETRRRLRERKNGPDGLDSKDAEGGAALGDPTSMRSWLSCLDIVDFCGTFAATEEKKSELKFQ
jgi:hypothetical protein